MLISGCDVADDADIEANSDFEPACLDDVSCMQELIGSPHGTIPRNKIHRITPQENKTEREIEEMYSHITAMKPTKIVYYYSGHYKRTWEGLYVSSDQGNALSFRRLNNFLDSLMPDCTEMWVILDCCSAGTIILIPKLPANVMPARHHTQWCSCMNGGTSVVSKFTNYIDSALTNSRVCPNKATSCPACSKFKRSISPEGHFTWTALEEYVNDHARNCDQYPKASDLPIFIVNPEPFGLR